MDKRERLVVGGLLVIAAVLALCALQVAARLAAALADPRTGPAAMLQQASLLLAVGAAAAFALAVSRASIRLARENPSPWHEPCRGVHRIVGYVATGLVGLAAAPSGGAAAAAQPASSALASASEPAPTTAPDPTWQPTGARRAPTPPPEIRLVGGNTRDAPEDARSTVVVRRGDCLWDIVARALGPTATRADIDRAWPRWYAANRAVIGSDPNLLRPGQQLRAPSGGA